ncbi:MAG TPA: GYF domain-containing protein [Pirellulaceae bacterium]|nr:GYF domain-containing protein [Pirellulaceae bacterium]
MSQWYCKLGGAAAGPFSRDELDYLFHRGQLTSDTQMRLADERNWSSAADLLTDLFPPPAAPAQPARQPVSQPAAEPAVPAPAKPKSQPAASKDESDAQRRRKQLLLGAGIGIGSALLIFLLLLLLLTFGGFGRGNGFAGQGGQGTGVGTGTGSGVGPGSGSGTGGGNGSGTGRGTGGGTQATVSGPRTDAKPKGGGAGGGQAPSTGAGEKTGPGRAPASDLAAAPPPENSIQKFTEQPPAPAAGGSAAGSGDGSFLGGGGGGGSDGTEFLGLKARGNKIVYIIDCSGSMAGQKLANAKQELIDSIKRLRPQQSAYVFFFASGSYPMFGPDGPVETKLLKCTPANVQKMEQWINNFNEGGGTNPRESLLAAVDLRPDVIFFLTDGGFHPGVADEVRTKNHGGEAKVASINTICFTDRSGEPVMQKIANENKGDYKFVP